MPGANAYAHVPLSDKEKVTMACALQCLPELPKPDMERLAQMAGYSTAGSASYAWSVIKAKLKYLADNGGSTDGGNPSPGKKARSAGDNSNKASPSKKRKRSKTANDDEDEDEQADVKDEPSENGDADDDA